MAKSRAELKSRFKAGSKPLESDFVHLIDAYYHKDEDEVGLDGITVESDSIIIDRSLHLSTALKILPANNTEGAELSFDSDKNLILRSLQSNKSIHIQAKKDTNFNTGLRIDANGYLHIPHEAYVYGGLDLRGSNNNSAELFFSRITGNLAISNVEVLAQAQASTELVTLSGKSYGKAALTLTCFVKKPLVTSDSPDDGISPTQEVLRLESGLTQSGAQSKAKTNGKVIVLGDFTVVGATVSSGSDIRIKKSIQDFTDGLEIVKQLRPVSFQYNGKGNTPDDGITRFGFIAQEVKLVCPQMLHTFEAKLEKEDEKETELLNLDTSSLQFILLNAIVELDNKVESLKKQLSQKTITTKEKIKA